MSRPERRSCRAAGGDPPAAAQPDQGAAGGAPAASARARLLRVLRQRLQVRPPAQSGRCREPPLPPAGPPRQPSALGLCLCSLYPHMFSRAYINFKNQEDIVLFRDRFDGYVFVDHKGKWTALGGCCCFPRCLVGFGRGGCDLFGFSASYNSSSTSRNTYIYRYIVTITF